MDPALKKVFVRLLMAAAGLVFLTIVVFVVWRIRLAKDIDRQLAAIRAAGLPTNGEEANTYYSAVPDAENAAVKMAEAFLLITNYSDSRSKEVAAIKFPSRKDALSAAQLDLLAGYCAMNSNALAHAAEAVKLPRCRYPIDLSWGVNTLAPHLSKLKRLSVIAEYDSSLDPKSSATNISIIIGMARTLDAEPVLISKLVRIALLNMAKDTLERRLNTGDLDDAELKQLGELFAEAAKTNQVASGLIGERAMFIRYFHMSYAEIQRLSDSGNDNSTNSSNQGGPPMPGPQPPISVFTGFFERDLRFYLQAMETNISLATTFPKNIAMITNVQDQISRTSWHNYYIFSAMVLPALENTIFKEANGVAQVRSAQTALAIQRFRLAHGKLPDDLHELVPQFLSAVPEDPFDGKLLRYHHLEKGYVVYSIGSDGEDNGGRERPANAKSTDKTHYDITFTVER